MLLDSAARREYDRRVVAGDVVETVPPEFVAGAPGGGGGARKSEASCRAFSSYTGGKL